MRDLIHIISTSIILAILMIIGAWAVNQYLDGAIIAYVLVAAYVALMSMFWHFSIFPHIVKDNEISKH